MYAQGVEMFMGVQWNPQFGPMIALGLGGVFTEILNDVVFRLLPITEKEAREMIRSLRGAKILSGFRGQPPVSESHLAKLLLQASRLGMDYAHQLESLDLNPIAVWEDQHVVLDYKLLRAERTLDTSMQNPNPSHLDGFFNPESVAMVGASDDRDKLGYAILQSLAEGGFDGRIYPVNPKRNQVQELRSFPSVLDIPGQVDLAVMAIPLARVPEAVRSCVKKGVRNVIIVSGGGKESGDQGRDIEKEIQQICRTHGVRVVGPNCIGVFNGRNQFDTFFQTRERMSRPQGGHVAVLTQSGTVGASFLESALTLGISKFVSYGNRLDVDEADLLTYLGEDPDTRVIACYIEGLHEGRKFIQTASRVTKQKPVVVFKSGRTGESARASLSHTGFFGGTYQPWAGALEQAGVVSVDSYESLYTATKALAKLPLAKGNHAAMISNGAGPMVQALDAFPVHGLALAKLSEKTINKLTSAYPPHFSMRNPIDVTGSGTSQDYAAGIEAVFDDPGVDIVMPWFVFQDPAISDEIIEVLKGFHMQRSKPIVCGAIGGDFTASMSQRLEASGIPVFHSVADWVVAAAALWRAGLVLGGG